MGKFFFLPFLLLIPCLLQAQQAKKNVAPKGAETYKQFCAVCHAGGLANAPIFKDKVSWQERLKQKNLAQLTTSAIKGLNAMPPKGTCMACSEQDIKNAINYMLPNVKKNI